MSALFPRHQLLWYTSGNNIAVGLKAPQDLIQQTHPHCIEPKLIQGQGVPLDVIGFRSAGLACNHWKQSASETVQSCCVNQLKQHHNEQGVPCDLCLFQGAGTQHQPITYCANDKQSQIHWSQEWLHRTKHQMFHLSTCSSTIHEMGSQWLHSKQFPRKAGG